jgi:hypothetical protein
MIFDFARPLQCDVFGDKRNPNRIKRLGVQAVVERRDPR